MWISASRLFKSTGSGSRTRLSAVRQRRNPSQKRSWHALRFGRCNEWLWHEQHPGQDTEHNKDFGGVSPAAFPRLPRVEWITVTPLDAGNIGGWADVAEALKCAR